MAKLTDLPNALLALVFRQFLSKSLADHDHLCQWTVEPHAASLRANLCHLATVCKRLSQISLPLLYEQLFRPDDFKRCVLSNGTSSAVSSNLAHIRYLNLAFKTEGQPKEDSKLY
jgi:hypothetical protein